VREQLESILSESVSCARQRERQEFARIAGRPGVPIVLYGAGNLGRKVLAALRNNNSDAIAFVDANPALDGKRVSGVPVLAPAEAVRRFGKEAVFVVCVWHPASEGGMQSILSFLRNLGAERVTSFVPLFWEFAPDLLPYYLWDLPSRLLAQKELVREACAIFSDQSQDQLVAELRLRLYADFGATASPIRTPQYFAKELFDMLDAECFIDCGAYDGDTIREFVAAVNGRFPRLIAFEADTSNFQRLKKWVSEQPREINERINILEKAVGRVSGTLRFVSTAGANAAVSATGNTLIAATTLDEALVGEVPTFIKMDIEGSEMDALEGAAHVITTHRPLMAVCIYHQLEHLWQIPLLIKRAQPDARLFLKSYAVDGWESVCYAVPESRLRKAA